MANSQQGGETHGSVCQLIWAATVSSSIRLPVGSMTPFGGPLAAFLLGAAPKDMAGGLAGTLGRRLAVRKRIRSSWTPGEVPEADGPQGNSLDAQAGLDGRQEKTTGSKVLVAHHNLENETPFGPKQ